MMKLRLLLIVFLLGSTLLSSNTVFGQIKYGKMLGSSEDTAESNIDYSNPKNYEIAEIKVSGIETLNETALVSVSGLKVGDVVRIPGEAISGAIKKIYKQGLTGDVGIYASKVEGNKIFLVIQLAENPRLTRYTFEGINSTQESELKDKVDLLRGRVLSKSLVKSVETTVKKYFIEKGYLYTEVDLVEVKDDNQANGRELKVKVTKGKKTRINRIFLSGNENIYGAKIKRKMKGTNEHLRFWLPLRVARGVTGSKPRDLANFVTKKYDSDVNTVKQYFNDNMKLNFFKSSKFSSDTFEEDKDAVISFYNSKGYRNASIVSDSVVRIDEDLIDVYLTVDEGNQHYFRNIKWVGNYVYADKQLDDVLRIDKGDVYDLEKLDKRMSFNPDGTPDINSMYLDNGYLFFRVEPVETRIENDSIDIEMRINEGKQARINKVLVKGNDRTNDHVIRREITTLPGDYFSRRALIQTQQRLNALGYFDPETFQMNPLPNPADNTVDIEYIVTERPSDQIELSGGWGGFYGFVGTFGLVFNNFSVKNIPHFEKWNPLPVGDGQKLSLRLQANGKQFQSYTASFMEPWLGGKKPHSLTVSLNHSVQRSVSFFTNEDFGGLKVSGITVGLGRRLRWPDQFFSMTNSLQYLRYDLDRNGTFAAIFENGTGVANSITLNTVISRNSLDNPTYTRNGSSLSLSVNVTPPYSALNSKDYGEISNNEKFKFLEYHKTMFDASWFTPLIGDFVLHAKSNFGFIGKYGDAVGFGPFERFWLGGSGMGGQFGSFLLGTEIVGLRGYEDNSIVPQDAEFVRGGLAYNKFTMELRYPVSLNPGATIYLLGFVEGGNTWNNYSEFDPFNLYKSAGVGARIFMPQFGLIGIDWAYGFDKLPGQLDASGSQFHFTIGQQLR